MRILVTGASGFLGSHVADALSQAGHSVILFDREPSAYCTPGQQMIVGDVMEFDRLLMASRGCDAIYHLAAIADIGEASSDPLMTVRVNVIGTSHALECARRNGIKRFVYASTIYVYSNHGSFYRTTKRCGEQLVEDYAERYQLPYTIVRFGSLYGPRANDRNTIHRVINQALHEGRITYQGTGEEMREYIHVLDAAQAAVQILSDEFRDQSVALTGHERMSSAQMLEMISEIMGGSVDVSFERDTQQGHYVQTPYNYTPKLGKKLVRNAYIDMGLGLLDCIRTMDQRNADTAYTPTRKVKTA